MNNDAITAKLAAASALLAEVQAALQARDLKPWDADKSTLLHVVAAGLECRDALNTHQGR